MNIQEYISSGVLEAYVLGELSREEAREVELLAEKHIEVREEIAKIESTLEKMAFRSAITPPQRLKNDILSKIEEKAEDAVTFSSTRANYWKYAAAASIALAIISSFLAWNYREQWKKTEHQLNDLIAQNERVAQDFNKASQQLERAEQDLGIINDPLYRKVALPGTENAPNALALVYWNPSSEAVYLNAKNLAGLPEENQYQLWAIVDGQPVDAGVFDVENNGLLKMKNISGASAFAVTIEPRGGSTVPSLETMQVMGAVGEG